MSRPSHNPTDGRPRGRFRAFFFAPASAAPLASLRIGIASILLAQAFNFRRGVLDLLGSRGIVEWNALDKLHRLASGPLGVLLHAFEGLHPDADRLVGGLGLIYVASLVGLGLGWRVRWTAPLAWCSHLGLMLIGKDVAYGVDSIANVALFYSIWMPVGQAASLDVRAGRTALGPSPEARFALRVLQLHLCIIYLASGATKAAGIQWWNGEAIWRALMNPNYRQLDFSWLAEVPWLAKLLCWGTLAVELGFPALIWPARTRQPVALAVIALHLGIALALGLWFFSAFMIALVWSAFLVPCEPHLRNPCPRGVTMAFSGR